MNGDATVVGGGLAGLVAATRLAEAGADVTLYERRPDIGGRVRTETVDGFTLDRGFQVLFSSYPAVERELGADGLDDLDLRPFAPGATICRPGSRSTLGDPLRDPRSAVPSLLNDEVSLSDKLRTLALRYDLGNRDEGEFFDGPDAPIREYLRDWGFADDYVTNFVEPFYGGITLDRSLATSKHVFEYTFRAMSRGSIGVPAEGMVALPAALADRAREAGVDIETGEDVETVRIAGQGRLPFRTGSADADGATVELADGSTRETDAVVVAASPPEARRLTGVESIPTEGVPNVTGWYALPESAAPDAGKRILLNAASESPNAVVPMSEVAPEYAPDGRALLAATFLGEDSLERDDGDLREDVRDALASWFPDREFDELETVDVHRIRFAQFAQPPGVHVDLPDVDDPEGPVTLAGDYTEWSSIQGALESGRKAAAAAREHL
ncbi:FAD-dependent oxidoreductase [Halorubrum sp. GN11_10-6_MGM]|uniref:NAD(P)/FAD-dependent oxidoreductase n=1 Tax=Halorubrum sp. GN11_10-6_MGM TaxID=2518112 RepID=UPI0010F530C2|nr:NAD(P)/FAD-dependent oxidoreductase [Halorubrum sp. GN11_10-6_MGM]TKX72362.1 FAD-dependent oxidoreductase [Halorubrum sp. GN11_10-6_MGM]